MLSYCGLAPTSQDANSSLACHSKYRGNSSNYSGMILICGYMGGLPVCSINFILVNEFVEVIPRNKKGLFHATLDC